MLDIGSTRMFVCGGIEGKCIAQRAKIQNLPKMANFCQYFPSDGDKMEAEPDGGSHSHPHPLVPPLMLDNKCFSVL